MAGHNFWGAFEMTERIKQSIGDILGFVKTIIYLLTVLVAIVTTVVNMRSDNSYNKARIGALETQVGILTVQVTELKVETKNLHDNLTEIKNDTTEIRRQISQIPVITKYVRQR